MIAKIKYGDKEFFSYIYFIGISDYRTKVIVFNDMENKFEFIDAYANKYTSERIVSLFDYKEDGLTKKKNLNLEKIELHDILAYPWLINNESLINDIINNNDINEEYKEIAKNMNKDIDVYKWHDVTTQEDIDELLDISGAFHDSYIRDIKGNFGRPYDPEFETSLEIAFEMYGNHFDIVMEFSGGVYINYFIGTNLNDIYLSSILFHNELIYWLDGGDDLRAIDIKDHPHISAKKLRWKIIDKLA